MNTSRISEEEIKGMNPVAVGYKIFPNDFIAHGYDYKDENENVVGTIHKVEGNIEECRWGLHFSELPQDCFNFYESVQWNKFAKVEAYDKVIKSGKKSVTNILKIVEVYSFNEFISLIQKALQSNGVDRSYGVNGSKGVDRSYGVSWSKGVNESKGVNGSKGVDRSYGITKCEAVSKCIFCFNKVGTKLKLFNKKTTEERFAEIWSNIEFKYGWYPKFNNAEKLKGNLEWYETNIPAIVNVPNEIAWGFMPEAMKEYIQSLPEYSEKIFRKVTGKIHGYD